MTKNATDCVCASSIPEGTCFVKRYGTYAYLRLSRSALRFHGLDENKIIGVNAFGNMAEVSPQKLVRPVPHSELLDAIARTHYMEALIGSKGEGLVRPTWVVEAFVQEQKITTHDTRRYLEIPMDSFKAGDRFRLVIEQIVPRDKERE